MPDVSHCDWLLLRGLTREAAHWGEFIGQLQRAFPHVRIHTLDLPGTGEFASQPSPDSMTAIVEWTRQQAAQRGLLQKPLILLGLSLGGMSVWQWLRQFPDDACAGVLINSSFAQCSPFYRRLRWQSYPGLLKAVAHRDWLAQEQTIADLVSNLANEQRQQAAQQWAAIRQLRPLSLGTAYCQIRAAGRFNPGLQAPKQPLLLINSLGDRLVSADCSATISRIYQLPLRSHPWAGHDLPLDDGPWLCEQLQRWLAELNTTPPENPNPASASASPPAPHPA